MRPAIVCGSHKRGEQEEVYRALDIARETLHVWEIVTGGADFIDTHAMTWAMQRRIDFRVIYAKWNLVGVFAGPSRNMKMLRALGNGGIVLAFDGDNGTLDMKLRARDALVPVFEWEDGTWKLDSFFNSCSDDGSEGKA